MLGNEKWAKVYPYDEVSLCIKECYDHPYVGEKIWLHHNRLSSLDFTHNEIIFIRFGKPDIRDLTDLNQLRNNPLTMQIDNTLLSIKLITKFLTSSD